MASKLIQALKGKKKVNPHSHFLKSSVKTGKGTREYAPTENLDIKMVKKAMLGKTFAKFKGGK